MSARCLRRSPRALEASAPPRRARRGAPAGRPARPPARPRPLPRPARPPARRRPAGRQHVGHACPPALPARRADGSAVDLHLSDARTPPADRATAGSSSCAAAARATAAAAPASASRCPAAARASCSRPTSSPGRLWIAALDLPAAAARLPRRARRARSATRTSRSARPLEDHQTIFATEPGSAEMPSAGRPFTPRVLDALRARGVGVAPHRAAHRRLARQERGERPYPERYRVPRHTAARVNATAPPAAA